MYVPSPNFRSLFESIGSRAVLASISVLTFGAIPNDGVDDSAQIQRAINASAAGDTIDFPKGTYNVAREVAPKGDGRILRGNGSTIVTTPQNPAFHFQGKGLTVTGFVFSGRGLFFDSNNGQMVEDVVVDNNTFQVQASGGNNPNGLTFTTGLRNSRITNNTFDPIHGDSGIFGYYWDGLVIANNAFLNGNEGMHLVDHSNNSKGLLVEQNYFSGLHRMGIEYQGGGWNTTVQDNYYENPVLMPNVNQNLDTFAYSIVCDSSNSTIVRRNYAKGTDRPDGTGVRVMYELGGFNLEMYDNYSEGGFNVIAANGTRATGAAHDNKIMNFLNGPYNANGAQVQFYNNGPDVQLSWDVNRPKPGPNGRLDVTDSPPPTTGPSPTADVEAPSDLSATGASPTRVDLTWKDNSNNEVGFKLERSVDQASWTQIALIAADREAFSNSGLAAGTTYYFRIRAYRAGKDTDYSNVATTKTQDIGGSGNGGASGSVPTPPTAPPQGPPTAPPPAPPTAPPIGP